MTTVLLLLAALFGGLRVAGVKSILFQGLAHIFVGGLGGAWAAGRRPLHKWLFVGLTVLEVVCFVASRLAGRA